MMATPCRRSAGRGQLALFAHRITIQFGGLIAVDDVTFTIPERAIVSLIGPNGAGKTTFFNVLTGLYKPTPGRSTSATRDITGLPPHTIADAGPRPDLPEHPAVRPHDRRGERHGGDALAHEGRASSATVLRFAPAAPGGAGGRGVRPASCSTSSASAGAAGRVRAQPLLRRPAPARGRPRAGAAAQGAAARRADRRHEPAGVGDASSTSSTGSATSRGSRSCSSSTT